MKLNGNRFFNDVKDLAAFKSLSKEDKDALLEMRKKYQKSI